MKNSYLLLIALFSICIAFTACNEDKPSDKPTVVTPPKVVTPTIPQSVNPSTPTTAVAGTVPHYICKNKCEGSGSNQTGNCPVCGQTYIHNEAFHNQAAAPQDVAPAGRPSVTDPVSVVPKTAAQNAKGVYHYICEKGCSGGTGAAGNCPTCGATLLHNADFHN